jgi:hypothetical protein
LVTSAKNERSAAVSTYVTNAIKAAKDAGVPSDLTNALSTANTNFVVSTPGGRVQAEKFLKSEIDKITDNDLKSEISKEYEKRKFETWRKWKRDVNKPLIKLPDIDKITQTTLVYIVNTYPEIVERYGEFLSTLNIDFDGVAADLDLSLGDAEKYIVSLKLQRYLDRLNIQKKELTTRLLSGDESARDEISKIDNELSSAHEKLEKLISL